MFRPGVNQLRFNALVGQLFSPENRWQINTVRHTLEGSQVTKRITVRTALIDGEGVAPKIRTKTGYGIMRR